MTGPLARLRGRLTFANVTAALALFIALGGTSYAAAVNSIGSAEIRTDAVGKSEIRTGGVGKSEIRTGAVSASELRRNGVGPSEVRAGAVGPAELRDDAVGAQHIAANAVGSSEIDNGSVALDDLATATRSAFQSPLGRVTINAAGGGVSGNATAATRTGTGVYTVTFANDVHECSYAATLANVGNEDRAGRRHRQRHEQRCERRRRPRVRRRHPHRGERGAAAGQLAVPPHRGLLSGG